MFFFFQAEDGIRDHCVTGVQTCALPILKESNAHHNYQQAIVEAQETDTVVIERSIGRPARVLKGRMSERILEVERSEEHTSELQSHSDLVCRLLLEKKKKHN